MCIVTITFQLQLHGNPITEISDGRFGFSGPQVTKIRTSSEPMSNFRTFQGQKIKTWISILFRTVGTLCTKLTGDLRSLCWTHTASTGCLYDI